MISVSVIIPVYNSASFICQALRSVAAQSLAPDEVIVVDDGSTDETGREVSGFAAMLPLVYRRQEHRGAGAARNLGASLARGDWLAFLDADDLWNSEKLATQAKHIEQEPDVSFFYSDVDLLDGSGKLLLRRWATAEFVEKKPSSRQRLSRMIFRGQPFPLPSTVLMTRELFERAGGFNPAFGGKYHEDFEFFARLAEMAPMRFLPQSLAQHRSHESLSQAQMTMDQENWLLFLDCMWQNWRADPAKQIQLLRYFAKHYDDQAKRHLRAGNYAEARRCCRRAAGYHPLSFTNLRHWGLSYVPVVRELYGRRAGRKHRGGSHGRKKIIG